MNDKWIMSAAHCFVNTTQDVRQLNAFAGTLDLTKEPDIELGVNFAITHPKYDVRARNDIALIRTKRSYSGSGKIYLANQDDVYVGQEAIIAGFGLTNNSGYPSKYLKTANITIFDDSICQKLAPYFWDSKVMLCAGDSKKDSAEGPCSSDSGGPLLVKNKDRVIVAGIVSWGPPCGDKKHPEGAYTRVSAELSWIKDVMERYE